MALESLYLTREGYKKSVYGRKDELDEKSLMRKNFESKYLDPDDIYIGHNQINNRFSHAP